MKRTLLGGLMALWLVGFSYAEQVEFDIVVKAGKHDYKQVPVCVPLNVPKSCAKVTVATMEGEVAVVGGQLTVPALTTESVLVAGKGTVRRDLHFILPELKAGAVAKLTAKLNTEAQYKSNQSFVWTDKKKEYSELGYQDGKRVRPILRYMKKPYDTSSDMARNQSYKVFHHVYDLQGKRFVTNGGHTDLPFDANNKQLRGLLFPHHRGLMFGFNRITWGGNKKADVWHCRQRGKSENYIEHVKTLSQESGPILGRHRVLIDWHGSKTDVFAQEVRELTVYKVPGGTLVEFASLVKTTSGDVILDGDPQHAGFQFRASNDVARKTKKQTYYLRPETGKGKLGQTINWPGNKSATVDLPWKAMSFVLDGKRYTAAYLDHPMNPGEARHSERDYGRFGYYFTYKVTEKTPLLVNYRVWLQDGEMTMEEVDDLRQDFVTVPEVSVRQS